MGLERSPQGFAGKGVLPGMTTLNIAAAGLSRGLAALDGVSAKIAARSVDSAEGGPAPTIEDTVAMRVAMRDIQANTRVMKSEAAREKHLLDLFV